jgi:hypothetical protein
MDNGSQKNLVSQELVQHLQIPTTPHPKSYQLGWVQKDGRASWYLNIVLSLFSIGQFKFFPLRCLSIRLCQPPLGPSISTRPERCVSGQNPPI